MKGTYLGEFQEVVLLTILALGKEAYGVSIQEDMSERLNRSISRGALHAALKRLAQKGYVTTHVGGATSERGGRRKKYYTVTNVGRQAVVDAWEIRDNLWNLIPKLST